MDFEINQYVPDTWLKATIEEVCTTITSGGTPNRRNSEFYKDGTVPWVKTKELNDSWIDEVEEFITEEAVASSAAKVLPKNTVLLAMYGATVGQLGILRTPMACNQASCAMVVDPKIANYRYLFYLLLSQRSFIKTLSTGAAQQNLNGVQIRNFRLPFPRIQVQEHIAHILGTLDDKIELNRQMNETLEAIARAIFRDWFVDFGPTRAKAEGCDPYLPSEIWDLFPDSLQDSKFGAIPRGWTVTEIQDLCDLITSGGTPSRKKSEFWENGEIPWFKTGELIDEPLLDSLENITEEGLHNSSCKLWPPGTILFALYAAPTVGRLGILTKDATANQAAAALVANPSFGVPFLKEVLILVRSQLQQIAVGAAQQNINQRILKTHNIVSPPAKLAKFYSNHITPFYEQTVLLAKQSRTLMQTRDLLLPKLVSGEICLVEAEKIAEAVR